ncbi:MAG TPA: DUF2513 domain-containing protein [Dongiaceae bacterium]|nr:DUF2513 domain-containing protein [Dongiaceae bacterium]
MRRDMDLCREILRRVEAHPRGNEAFRLQIEGRSAEEVSYHVKILGQAGLLETYRGPADVSMPVALTWAGCEFMDATRDDHRWRDVKARALRATGSLGFEVVKTVITHMTEAAVKAIVGAST